MKNKNDLIIRILSVTLSVLMCLFTLAGCGRNTAGEQAADTASAATASPASAAADDTGKTESEQKDGLPSNETEETTGTNGTNCFLFYNNTNGYLNVVAESTVYSGTTEPTAPYAWYDITNNVIVRNTGSSTFNYSLPLAKVICNSSNQISSIDQIFNGFGYIGSHGFALPGIKGLIPDGRNSDGTLKSIEYTQEDVLICDLVTGEGTDRQDLIWGIGDCSLSWSSSDIDNKHFIRWGQTGGNVRCYNTRPSQAPQTYTRAYIEDENRWIIAASDGNYTWGAGSNEETNRFFTLAHYEIQNSKISSMKLHTIAHLVNFNDIDYIIATQNYLVSHIPQGV